MKSTTTWISAAILALAAATALAQDKQGSIARLEQSIERLEKSVERLERAISMGGMMGGSRPNEQWRTPGNSR